MHSCNAQHGWERAVHGPVSQLSLHLVPQPSECRPGAQPSARSLEVCKDETDMVLTLKEVTTQRRLDITRDGVETAQI